MVCLLLFFNLFYITNVSDKVCAWWTVLYNSAIILSLRHRDTYWWIKELQLHVVMWMFMCMYMTIKLIIPITYNLTKVHRHFSMMHVWEIFVKSGKLFSAATYNRSASLPEVPIKSVRRWRESWVTVWSWAEPSTALTRLETWWKSEQLMRRYTRWEGAQISLIWNGLLA